MIDTRSPLRGIGTDPASVRQRVEALEKIMERKPANGVALAFGPGVAMEGFRFGWTDGNAG